MKTIKIPETISNDLKFQYWPAVSKEIMKSFYRSRGESDKLIEPKSKEISFYHNGKYVVDACKCKTRVNMPNESTFMIDVAYVKKLEKLVKEKSKLYKIRGLLVFPVIDERKIYMINIDKLDKTMKDEQWVNDTFSDTKTQRKGKYYYIPRERCAKFDIPGDLEFEILSEGDPMSKFFTVEDNDKGTVTASRLF